MFIGRKNELATLEDLYTEDVFQCVIIYGRRRVGKTTMLSEFCKSKNHIFFSAQETTSSAMLKDFSKKELLIFLCQLKWNRVPHHFYTRQLI